MDLTDSVMLWQQQQQLQVLQDLGPKTKSESSERRSLIAADVVGHRSK